MNITIELEPSKDGLLLTQYEKYGILGYEEFKQLVLDEYIDFDENDISDYNEFLYETEAEPCPLETDLDVLFENYTPTQIARACFYGEFKYDADYYCFNGDGNVDSFYTYEAIRLMKENEDFKDWYFSNKTEFENDEIVNEVIKEGNRLLKLGY